MRILTLFFCLFFASAFANPGANNSTAQGAAEPQIFKLPNGLTLVVKENHRSPLAVVMVWYKVGSAYEASGTTGISHALEHMMFHGTPMHPENQLVQTVTRHGGQENAFTTQDYTAYFEKVDSKLVPMMLQLEADRMQHLSLTSEDFTKEIQVVREERRMRIDDNPQALTFEHFMAAAYLSTPYHNPVIGWPDDIEQLTIEDLRHWYQTWYAPNNATIVVAGDVNAQEIFKEVKDAFGKANAKVLPPFKYHQEPLTPNRQNVVIQAHAESPTFVMGYVMPSYVTDKSWKPYALTLLSGILDAGRSSRLNQDLVQENQIASQVGAYYDGYSLYQSTFLLWGVPTPKHSIAELQNTLQVEIDRLCDAKVSVEELERVKQQMIAHTIYEQDDVMQMATNLGIWMSLGLGPTMGDYEIQQLKSITPEQLQEVAKEYFKANRLVTATLEPKNA